MTIIDRITNAENNVAARELALTIANYGDIYESVATPFIKNMARHIARNEYDEEKALVAVGYLVQAGAKKYIKEHGSGGPVSTMFEPADLHDTALLLLAEYAEEITGTAGDMIGPRRVEITVSDFGHDVYGNPTARYSSDYAATARRVQCGYHSNRDCYAGRLFERAGHRFVFYTLDNVQGSRPDDVVLTYTRDPVTVAGFTEINRDQSK